MTRVVALTGKPDHVSLAAFRDELLEHRGTALSVDVSGVERIGALALEVMMSAARQWKDDGTEFAVIGSSPVLDDICQDLGITPEAINRSETGSGQ